MSAVWGVNGCTQCTHKSRPRAGEKGGGRNRENEGESEKERAAGKEQAMYAESGHQTSCHK